MAFKGREKDGEKITQRKLVEGNGKGEIDALMYQYYAFILLQKSRRTERRYRKKKRNEKHQLKRRKCDERDDKVVFTQTNARTISIVYAKEENMVPESRPQ